MGPSQKPGAAGVRFPGAVDSKFTSSLSFQYPETNTAIPTYRTMSPEGEILDSTVVLPSDDAALKMYLNMIKVSIMDLIMVEAQRQGRLSFYMPSQGEEGICVGSAAALEKDDVIFSQYREAGVFMQKGYTLEEFMSQLFANRKDKGRGRNMPVHYGSKELNIHSISSPLATQIPHASGAAYALKLQRISNPSLPPRVVACYFGEGAASEGDFHGALNIAATRSCPVIFICRNNGYAISTPTLEQYRGDGIASRGIGYGIDTIRVDGNDIWAVREVTMKAREIALKDGGRPVLIEAMSYRISHHSTSDDSFAYRARVEVEDWKRRDNPITRLRKYLERKGVWDESQEIEARTNIKKEILRALSEAEKEKKPPIRSMFEDVYKEMTPELKEQMGELRRVMQEYPEEYDVGEFEGGVASLK
ncbi:2-oxoisovalerate dehydrogenase alpha subunit, mitochondrial precursor [Sclerotinia borealis F-4128]|uniref:2-oxoisovalerate dehydrogenase subunit alpha n=1 Tax=Sclerotinia borealis (strain F-4128) TaxID=1432307 RepID=W9CLK8_SCLBF|nr:2-oxoisovalerate dehydrogenase alpha subunit, mitochondrial precursor [Sclerotinia borealis F-4128]